MAYSESLADRIRWLLADRKEIVEKKMFSGLAFLLNGNMCVGVWKCSLIARVGPDQYEHALQEEHVVEFDITGRAMTGWIIVEPDGFVVWEGFPLLKDYELTEELVDKILNVGRQQAGTVLAQ